MASKLEKRHSAAKKTSHYQQLHAPPAATPADPPVPANHHRKQRQYAINCHFQRLQNFPFQVNNLLRLQNFPAHDNAIPTPLHEHAETILPSSL